MSIKRSDLTPTEVKVICRALACFISEAGSLDRDDVQHAERLMASFEDSAEVHLEGLKLKKKYVLIVNTYNMGSAFGSSRRVFDYPPTQTDKESFVWDCTRGPHGRFEKRLFEETYFEINLPKQS